jgi:cellulose synthase operon protein C
MPVIRMISTVSTALLLAVSLATPAGATDSKVDEAALRYYAAHNQMERAQAEIRRLQALYPDWVAPTDLTALPADRETPLWDLFRKGDRTALAAAIDKLKAQDPTFQPSADLKAQMDRRQARDGLIAASDAGDAAKVLAIAAGHTDMIGCADLDVSWRVAAARATQSDHDGSLALYTHLLDACPDASARLATVQKAIAALGADGGHLLLTHEKTPGEFDALRPDFARAAIAAQLSGGSAPDPDARDLAVLEASATAGPKPDDAMLLGWWYRANKRSDKALAAFRTAATLAGPQMDAKIAEGLVLSLDDLHQRAEAVRVAHDNRSRSDTINRLYVDLGTAQFEGEPRPVLAAPDIADYGAAVTASQSPAGAEVLGWYLYDLKRPADAAPWFDRGLAWKPSAGLASGAIYAALALKDEKAALALVATWRGPFPEVANIRLSGTPTGKPAGKDAILVAFQAGNYSRCAALSDARGKLKPDLSVIKGWCLMKLQRPVEAAAAFELGLAGNGKVRQDAAYGKSLAAMAAGDVQGAVATAMNGVAAPERRAEIGAAVLADTAQARFNAKDWHGALAALEQRAAFTAETTDLALLRGWCLWHVGNRSEARALFLRLDNTLSTAETRRAVANSGGRS